MKSIDKYIFQALDNYPFSLEGTIESLDYALSQDPNNTMALTLYGRIYSEQLKDFEEAKRYFQQALSVNIHGLEIYGPYIEALIWSEDYQEAENLIDFALQIKGIDKAEIYLKKVLLYESQMMIKDAKKTLKMVELHNCNSANFNIIDDFKDRLKTKLKILYPEKYKKTKEAKSKKNAKSPDENAEIKNESSS